MRVASIRECALLPHAQCVCNALFANPAFAKKGRQDDGMSEQMVGVKVSTI